MYVNNNLYFVVGNLVTEIYFFQQEVLVYACIKSILSTLFAFGFVILRVAFPLLHFHRPFWAIFLLIGLQIYMNEISKSFII